MAAMQELVHTGTFGADKDYLLLFKPFGSVVPSALRQEEIETLALQIGSALVHIQVGV